MNWVQGEICIGTTHTSLMVIIIQLREVLIERYRDITGMAETVRAFVFYVIRFLEQSNSGIYTAYWDVNKKGEENLTYLTYS